MMPLCSASQLPRAPASEGLAQITSSHVDEYLE